jgi:hypothetical protein
MKDRFPCDDVQQTPEIRRFFRPIGEYRFLVSQYPNGYTVSSPYPYEWGDILKKPLKMEARIMMLDMSKKEKQL